MDKPKDIFVCGTNKLSEEGKEKLWEYIKYLMAEDEKKKLKSYQEIAKKLSLDGTNIFGKEGAKNALPEYQQTDGE